MIKPWCSFTISVCESLNAILQSETLLICETIVGSYVLFCNLQIAGEPSNVEAYGIYTCKLIREFVIHQFAPPNSFFIFISATIAPLFDLHGWKLSDMMFCDCVSVACKIRINCLGRQHCLIWISVTWIAQQSDVLPPFQNVGRFLLF